MRISHDLDNAAETVVVCIHPAERIDAKLTSDWGMGIHRECLFLGSNGDRLELEPLQDGGRSERQWQNLTIYSVPNTGPTQ